MRYAGWNLSEARSVVGRPFVLSSAMIGSSVGPYRILERLGRGGMAVVYKAYQPGLDRYVALKILPAHLADEPGFGERFKREARAVAKLEHPHILPVYDYGQEGDLSYIAMRYVEGGTLKGLLGEPLELPLIVDLIGQIGEALDYAHEHGVIHRDVKPSNVLLDKDNWALLTDFGVARMVEATQQLTATGVGVGTPAYMSPEQGQGKKVDGRSDIYSLGVTLYEMLTGRVPFEAETPLAVVWKHVNEPLPLPSSINPEVPEAVERVVLKAMAKAPEDRYSTAGELAMALQKAVRKRDAEEGVRDQGKKRDGLVEVQGRTAKAGFRRNLRWLLPLLILFVSLGVLLTRRPMILQSAQGRADLATASTRVGAALKTETPLPSSSSVPLPERVGTIGIQGSPSPSYVCNDLLGCVTVDAGKPIQIAYILSMSQDLGVDSERGAEIALDDTGAVRGHELQLIGEDDGCNPDRAREVASRLALDKSIVAIIGTNCSGSAYAIAPFLSDAGLTMVSPSNTRPDLTDPAVHSSGYLRVVASDVFQAKGASSFAYDQLGLRSAAIIYQPGNAYSEGVAFMFRDEFIGLGGQVVASATIESGQTQMTQVLAGIASKSPDLIYFTGFPPEGAAILRQAGQTSGLESTVMMGADSLWAEDFITASGDLAEGMYVSASAFESKQSPEYQAFLSEYRAKYGEAPLTAFHAHGYDATRMILAIENVAIQDADGTLHIGRQALRDALYATRDFEGLTGVLNCNQNGDCGVPEYVVFQLHNGEFVRRYP
jgi:branched-chain amino acid transport system substrate-binding protein